MSVSMIQARDLRKIYRMGRAEVRAVDGVQLDIAPRSFVAVLGPSGSGKSTLLYLLGGLDRPTSGSIILSGLALEAMDENTLATYRRERIGFIFQSFNLIASMTALENVAFPLRFAGIPRRAREVRALELLEEVGLADRAHHRPTELSGGQQQRVAIARALVNDPELILADEPTGNLDTRTGSQILTLLADLHRKGRTVLVVSHDPRVAHFSTNTIRLVDGRIVEEAHYSAALSRAAAEIEST